jgi:hypothetical protein
MSKMSKKLLHGFDVGLERRRSQAYSLTSPLWFRYSWLGFHASLSFRNRLDANAALSHAMPQGHLVKIRGLRLASRTCSAPASPQTPRGKEDIGGSGRYFYPRKPE